MNKQDNSSDRQLYDLLTHYVNIMEKVKHDYKPYTPRALDTQLGQLYIASYRARYGYPPVLHDWGCQVCCLNNWRAFAKYYDTVLSPIYSNKKTNGKKHKTN